jgi:hypothetical protein
VVVRDFDLVVVRDFDIVCVAVSPSEAQAPLVINTDAVLPNAVAGQCLEVIAWRASKIIKLSSRRYHP